MSYEINYDKQFIKVKDKFLPFLLIGSNNLFEWKSNGRERRSREWWMCSPESMTPATEDEMIKSCQKQLQSKIEQYVGEKEYFGKIEVTTEEDVKKHYGYYSSLAIGGSTHNTSYKQYENLFRYGCKNAIDIQTLFNFNGSIRIHSGSYCEEKLKELNLDSFSISIESEDHFFEVYNEKKEIYGNTLRISLDLGEDKPKSIRSYLKGNTKRKEKEETVLVRLDGYYTVMAPNGGYFHRNTKYGYRYSYSSSKKFATEELAKKFTNGKRNCVVKFERSEAVLRVKESLAKKLTNILVESN